MTPERLQVYQQGWLSNTDVAHNMPEYLRVYDFFDQMIERARLSGASEVDIANAMFQHHMEVLAALDPTDDQVDTVASLFTDAVRKLRDRDPEAVED